MNKSKRIILIPVCHNHVKSSVHKDGLLSNNANFRSSKGTNGTLEGPTVKNL